MLDSASTTTVLLALLPIAQPEMESMIKKRIFLAQAQTVRASNWERFKSVEKELRTWTSV